MTRNLNKKSIERILKGVTTAVFTLILSIIVIDLFPNQTHLIILIIALALIFIGLRGFVYYSRAEKWTPIQATIRSMKEEWVDVVLRYFTLRYFYPSIEYEYYYHENNYVSNSVSFEIENIWVPELDSWGTKTKSEDKFWYDWKNGDVVTIY